MPKNNIRKLAIAGLLCAVAVVGSLFSFPVLGSRCSPAQHLVNVLCAVLLGPGWSFGTAFAAALIRNITGLGTLMAYPGSIFGALLAGLLYHYSKKIPAALVGEAFGTAVIGGLCAYPVAVFLMGKDAAGLAFYAYIIPFLISTIGGVILAGLLLGALSKSHLLPGIQASLNPLRKDAK